jgi:TM2 domain-containing membrane protein YozV
MLNKDEVQAQEERLRDKISLLDSEKKKELYTKLTKEIKDPDTYATLNWLLLTGLHHFYLRKWLNGSINLVIFIVSFILIFSNYSTIGLVMLGIILVVELKELFFSQVIVQDYNNKITEELLDTIK